MEQERGAWPVGMEPEPGARILDVGIGRYWIGSEGIVFNENLVRGTVDVDAVKRGVAAIAELCDGMPAVVLSHASSTSMLTPFSVSRSPLLPGNFST